MLKIRLQNIYLPISIVFITIASIKMHALIPINNTTIWWVIQIFVLSVLYLARKHFFDKQQEQILFPVLLYLLWNLFSVFRGVFLAENYWDWKNLFENFIRLMIPLVAYSATNMIITQSMLRSYFKYALPLFILFSFLITTEAYGFYLVPVSFILLFFAALTFRWKIIILLLTALVLLADFGARSNMVKFGISILLSLIYYFRSIIINKHFELVRKIMFILPFLFLYLAIIGTFNVFNMDNYIESDYTEEKINSEGDIIETSIKADTRTFLYLEVLKTAQKYNTWWLGRSPARGNETEWFIEDDLTGRGERNANEVGILNVFTWTGIVGVVLYFLMFYKASYLAVNYSNNTFSKILGVFVAFRWLYAWIEDYNYFTLTTFFLFIAIGICFSESFRKMTNDEVKEWIWGIFDKRYALSYKLKTIKKIKTHTNYAIT